MILISSLYSSATWRRAGSGTHKGTALTGLTGGLVSSTAVTLSFARQRAEGAATRFWTSHLASGILLAWGIMFVRVVVEVLIVNAALVPPGC